MNAIPLVLPLALARDLSHRAEASLIGTLATAGTYRDRAMWRRNVRTDLRRLRSARATYHAAWMAFVAERSSERVRETVR